MEADRNNSLVEYMVDYDEEVRQCMKQERAESDTSSVRDLGEFK